MNNNTIFTLLFSLIFNVLYSTPSFYLKVEDPSVWTAECALQNAQNESRLYKIELQKMTNDARFALDVAIAQFVKITYAGTSFDIFVEPNDEMDIFFRDKEVPKTLRFEGIGSYNNAFLSAFRQRFPEGRASGFKTKFLSPTIDDITEKRILSSDAPTFLSLLNANKEAALAFLASEKGKIHKKLYSYLWKEVHYRHETALYGYFLLKNMSATQCQSAAQQFFPSKGFSYADYERNETMGFRNALKTFVHYQAKQFKGNDDPMTLFQTIEKKLEGYDRFWLEKELFIEVLQATGQANFGRQHIQEFRKNCPYKELIKEIDDVYSLELDVAERAEAPDLELITVDGTPLYLKQFRGKVVYLSFWASWCQACISNFAKYEEMRNRLMADGVVLLNISIDAQPEHFRSAVRRLNIKGLNVQPMDIDDAKKAYNLYSIPSYFIIDKEGKFTHLSDKAGRDVLSEFKKLLAE